MRFLQRTAIATTIALALSAGAAIAAKGYTGNWPMTVSQSQHSNGTYCLTLTDGGSLGWPHSGFASLTGPGGKLPYGTFQVIGNTFIVTMEQSGYGQNAGLVFTAPTVKRGFGTGAYDQVYGGEAFDTGLVTFGAKGGC